MSALKGTACYIGVILCAMIVQLLLPDNEGDLLVIPRAVAQSQTPNTLGGPSALKSDAHMYALLANTDAVLINKLNGPGFVIRSPLVNGRRDNHKTIKTLYDNGAFLVVNAVGLWGCGSTEIKPKNRSYLS